MFFFPGKNSAIILTVVSVYGMSCFFSWLLFFFLYFLLKDNCFTEFCCFLSSLNMNQPSVQLSSFSSVTQSYPTLQPHELQHARLPYPSPTPGVHSNSCPSSRWCHPAFSCSVVPFSSCPQSLPHQGLFQWVNSSHEVAKVLEFQPQHRSFQRTARTDLL